MTCNARANTLFRQCDGSADSTATPTAITKIDDDTGVGIAKTDSSSFETNRCRYKTGRCTNERVVKPNGACLLLCESHRSHQNSTKKRSDRKYRQDRAWKRNARRDQVASTSSSPSSSSRDTNHEDSCSDDYSTCCDRVCAHPNPGWKHHCHCGMLHGSETAQLEATPRTRLSRPRSSIDQLDISDCEVSIAIPRVRRSRSLELDASTSHVNSGAPLAFDIYSRSSSRSCCSGTPKRDSTNSFSSRSSTLELDVEVGGSDITFDSMAASAIDARSDTLPPCLSPLQKTHKRTSCSGVWPPEDVELLAYFIM